jgi:hypothetical protein
VPIRFLLTDYISEAGYSCSFFFFEENYIRNPPGDNLRT